MTDRSNPNAGLGRENANSESSVDVEREPMPARTPDVDSDTQDEPPARSGNAAVNEEKPVEGDRTNATHHTGHMPPPVTANRE